MANIILKPDVRGIVTARVRLSAGRVENMRSLLSAVITDMNAKGFIQNEHRAQARRAIEDKRTSGNVWGRLGT
eukprot:4442521-Karenia_brevis.AAC.1